jgi:hypothetical protein
MLYFLHTEQMPARAASISSTWSTFPDKPHEAYIFRDPKLGPPPLSSGEPWRYDEQDGWHHPTWPCTGPKPSRSGQNAFCDVHTGKWHSQADRGAGSYFGSLVNLGPCAIDPLNPPPMGRYGKPVCDRFTGEYYYSSVDGHPDNDGFPNGRHAHRTFEMQKRKDPAMQRHGRGSPANLTLGVSGVSMDRAYGQRPPDRFRDPVTKRLPSALTGMGADRMRGYHQFTSQIQPSMTILARPIPRSHSSGRPPSSKRRPTRLYSLTS